MQGLLDLGTVLQPENTARSCEVVAFIGSGGQGEVYHARLGATDLALKWYLPGWAAPSQRQALLELIRRGPPSAAFLWPIDLVAVPGQDGFGYLMALREQRFCSVADLMRRNVEPDFRTLATVGFNVADSFLQLHAAGLCYRDISFGNLSFDPVAGDVIICDNDNVGVDGAREGGILGTPRFMAPEIVRGEAWPDSQTDLWSLAVLLFYVMFLHHPLEGRRERDATALDAIAMIQLYGSAPLFIFDPDDDSNRPVRGEQDNPGAFWDVYPPELRRLFTRAFTDGIRDPRDGRVREGEWRQAMVALRDAIVYCGACGAENFADTSGLGQPRPSSPVCWRCGEPVRLPFHLEVGRTVVMLNHDTRLYAHHLDPERLYDFSTAAATVVSHPTDPSVWGLRNEGRRAWTATRPDKREVTVDPGRTLPLEAGTRVRFGPSTGTVGRSAG